MRRSRLLLVLLAALLAGCGNRSAPPEGAQARGALRLLAAVPQDGYTLGDPDAPVVLTAYLSFTDLNRGFLREDLPRLIDEQVRPGRVKVVVRTVTLPGASVDLAGDGEWLARTAQGAGLQDRFWDFVLAFDRFYTGGNARPAAEAAFAEVPGIDRARVAGAGNSARVRAAIERANDMAVAAGIGSGSVVVEAPGGRSRLLPEDCAADCLLREVARESAAPAPTARPIFGRRARRPDRPHRRRALRDPALRRGADRGDRPGRRRARRPRAAAAHHAGRR